MKIETERESEILEINFIDENKKDCTLDLLNAHDLIYDEDKEVYYLEDLEEVKESIIYLIDECTNINYTSNRLVLVKAYSNKCDIIINSDIIELKNVKAGIVKEILNEIEVLKNDILILVDDKEASKKFKLKK